MCRIKFRSVVLNTKENIGLLLNKVSCFVTLCTEYALYGFIESIIFKESKRWKIFPRFWWMKKKGMDGYIVKNNIVSVPLIFFSILLKHFSHPPECVSIFSRHCCRETMMHHNSKSQSQKEYRKWNGKYIDRRLKRRRNRL